MKFELIFIMIMISLNLFAKDNEKQFPNFQNTIGVTEKLLTSNCVESGTLSMLSSQGLVLINNINNAIGVTPLFCRDAKVSTDDDNDSLLKKHIDELLSHEQKIGSKEQIENTTYNVLASVVMKKLWGMTSEKNRVKLFLSDSCKDRMLNKLPLLNSKKSSPESSAEKNKQVYDDFIKLCSNDFSLERLAPYLSKDVIAESMYVLSLVYPDKFLAVKEFTCNAFKKTPEVIFKDEKYENFFLGITDITDQQQYAAWIKSTFTLEANQTSQSKLNDLEINEKISNLFQLQGRDKKISEILSKKEIASIKNYTSDGYDQINGCLRTSKCDSKTLDDCRNITSALVKLKSVSARSGQNVLFRGARNVPDFVIDKVEKAAITGSSIILDKGFLSTSGNEEVAKKFAKKSSTNSFIYVLKSKSCVGIADISLIRGEDEFLCPAGMKFKVEKSGTDNIYILQEVEK